MIVAQTGDKRFKASQVDVKYLGIDNPVDKQIEDYCDLLWPIRDRIVCMMDSNHHLTIEEKTGTSPTRRIGYNLWGKDAESHLLGYSGFLVTRFYYDEDPNGRKNSRVKTLTWSLCHGIGTGGKTEGGFVTTLGHDATFYDADVHVYGHNHQLESWDRVVLGVDHHANRVISKKITRLNSGSYLKSVSDDMTTSYGEKSRFRPNSLGHMEFSVKFTKPAVETYYVKRMVL